MNCLLHPKHMAFLSITNTYVRMYHKKVLNNIYCMCYRDIPTVVWSAMCDLCIVRSTHWKSATCWPISPHSGEFPHWMVSRLHLNSHWVGMYKLCVWCLILHISKGSRHLPLLTRPTMRGLMKSSWIIFCTQFLLQACPGLQSYFSFMYYRTERKGHVIPVRRFFEAVFSADLRSFFAQTCFQLILTHGSNVPLFCQQHYLQGSLV